MRAVSQGTETAVGCWKETEEVRRTVCARHQNSWRRRATGSRDYQSGQPIPPRFECERVAGRTERGIRGNLPMLVGGARVTLGSDLYYAGTSGSHQQRLGTKNKTKKKTRKNVGETLRAAKHVELWDDRNGCRCDAWTLFFMVTVCLFVFGLRFAVWKSL